MDYQYNKVANYADMGNGNTLHYHDIGQGEPVIFLHGGGQGAGGWTNWQHNLQVFADAGYRAIAPDALGYGLSSKPADGNFDFETLMECLIKLFDHLKLDKVTLVGNSMGGAMSIRFSQDFLPRVKKLVVMGPGGIGPMERYLAMPAIQMLKALGQEEGGFSKDKLRRFLEFMAYSAADVTDQLVDERYEVAVTQPPRVFQTLSIGDLRPRLNILKNLPTMVLWGRDDRACPVESGMEIMQECDNARMIVFSQCGHWVQYEKAKLFNKLCLDFLKE
ncbi:MAG: alpha/beta fold hydrolase [Immundisolibacter sp.]|uniref:alpha/beta fold hydrolase n=2 Tax=Immundisolibacter sp. TaxID=1934948 RepID=UPI003563EBB0